MSRMIPTPRRVLSILALLLLGSALNACGTTDLRKAQDHFSSAARVENATRFGDPTQMRFDLAEVSEQQAIMDYQLAYRYATSAAKAPGRGIDAAQANRQRGTALMLQLYSLWRLAALNDFAEETALGDGTTLGTDLQAVFDLSRTIKDQAERGEIELGTRDRAMLAAIPGLLEHELGLRSEDWPTVDRKFCTAITSMEGAPNASGTQVPGHHPVRAHLHLQQIQSIGAWGDRVRIDLPENDHGNRELNRRNTRIEAFAMAPVCGIEAWAAAMRNAGGAPTRVSATRKLAKDRIDESGVDYDALAKDCSKGEPLPDCPFPGQ